MKFEYTRGQRLAIAEVLRTAKQALRTHDGGSGHTYICNAIRLSVDASPAKRRALFLVKDRLEGAHTLRRYLQQRGVPHTDDDTAMQRLRHAWLDDLIEEFSK